MPPLGRRSGAIAANERAWRARAAAQRPRRKTSGASRRLGGSPAAFAQNGEESLDRGNGESQNKGGVNAKACLVVRAHFARGGAARLHGHRGGRGGDREGHLRGVPGPLLGRSGARGVGHRLVVAKSCHSPALAGGLAGAGHRCDGLRGDALARR